MTFYISIEIFTMLSIAFASSLMSYEPNVRTDNDRRSIYDK